MTKEERAAEALKRRQEAVEEQRRKQEEEKKKQLEYLNQGREGEDHMSLYCVVCIICTERVKKFVCFSKFADSPVLQF